MAPKQAANDSEKEVTIERPDGSAVVLVRPRIRITGAGSVDEDGAAAYLGVSARSLQRYRKEHRGPVYYTLAGKVWYKISDLDEYLALWRVDPLAS
jgi:hypothetical protein